MRGHCCLSALRTEFLYLMQSNCSLKMLFYGSGGYSLTCHCGVPCWSPANPREVYTGRSALGQVLYFIRALWFRMSIPFHCCSIPIFMLMLRSPQDQRWKHGDLETKQCSLGYGGPLERKVLASCIVFRGLNTQMSSRSG